MKITASFLLAVVGVCIVLALVGCQSTQMPPRAVVATIQSAAVSPLVDRSKADAARTNEAASKLESKVDDLRLTTTALRAGMTAATAEAERLRDQKTASEKELQGLWELLTASDQHAKQLFAEVEKAKTIADQQKSFRLLAERNLDELAKAAIARDTETVELRAQRDQLSKDLGTAQLAYEQQAGKLATAEKRAAVGTYLKGCVWVLGISLLIIVALYVAVKIRIL